MTTYSFSVVASGIDASASRFEDRLFESGCGDALIVLRRGAVILEFDREADSLPQAIESAVKAIVMAGGTAVRIEPDPLVTMAEIAQRCGVTRSSVSHYVAGLRGEGFPAPVAKATSESPLWDWAEVAEWLHRKDHHGIAAETVKTARIVRQANRTLDASSLRAQPTIDVAMAEMLF